MKSRALLATVALLAALGWTTAPASRPVSGTLRPGGHTVSWRGSFSSDHLITPVPKLRCLEGACDPFRLRIALGNGFWQANPGGAVEIAVRWPYDGVVDLDLFVYDVDGTEVGRSVGLDSNAESVFLREPADGVYRVVVAPSNTVSPGSGGGRIRYEAIAQVEPPPAAAPAGDLLPNLISFPPDGFHIASALNLIPFPENTVLPCYPEETIENDSHPVRCLRFNQTIANVGRGRLELRFDMRGVATPSVGDDRMIQRIYATGGGSRDVVADRYQFHPVHAHVHYVGFGQSFLYPYAWDSGRSGPAERVGNKVGFCVTDVFLLDGYWNVTGNGPRGSQTFPGCNIPSQFGPGGAVWMVQGIDIGWADVYGWNLADQFIDITGVADGLYELEQVANPTGTILEETIADNLASTVICLKGDTVAPVTGQAEADACLA